MTRIAYKITALFLAMALALPAQSFAQVLPYMPPPGQMITPAAKPYDLPYIVGMRFSSDNIFEFTFFLNRGNVPAREDVLRVEVDKVGKYFLAALTIPEKDLWVNLSPYEQDRIITPELGRTDLGKDLLGEDYVLKQLASSLTYPDSESGKQYWQAVNDETRGIASLQKPLPNNRRDATLCVSGKDKPTQSFTKIWIVPGTIKMKEAYDRVVITEATLKVLTEEDYLATQKNAQTRGVASLQGNQPRMGRDAIPGVSNNVLAFKTHILPLIEKEVNTGKHFAHLRQLYRAIILAGWFKKKLKDTILNQVYFNQKKIKGAENNDPALKDKIYNEYVKAFNQGVYNVVKRESINYKSQITDYKLPNGRVGAGLAPARVPGGRIIRRQYFSGGMDLDKTSETAQCASVSAGLVDGAADQSGGMQAQVRMEEAPVSSQAAVPQMSEKIMAAKRNIDRAIDGAIEHVHSTGILPPQQGFTHGIFGPVQGFTVDELFDLFRRYQGEIGDIVFTLQQPDRQGALSGDGRATFRLRLMILNAVAGAFSEILLDLRSGKMRLMTRIVESIREGDLITSLGLINALLGSDSHSESHYERGAYICFTAIAMVGQKKSDEDIVKFLYKNTIWQAALLQDWRENRHKVLRRGETHPDTGRRDAVKELSESEAAKLPPEDLPQELIEEIWYAHNNWGNGIAPQYLLSKDGFYYIEDGAAVLGDEEAMDNVRKKVNHIKEAAERILGISDVQALQFAQWMCDRLHAGPAGPSDFEDPEATFARMMERELGDVAHFDFKGMLDQVIYNHGLQDLGEVKMKQEIDNVLIRLAGISQEKNEGRVRLITELLGYYQGRVEEQEGYIRDLNAKPYKETDLPAEERELTALNYIVRELLKLSIMPRESTPLPHGVQVSFPFAGNHRAVDKQPTPAPQAKAGAESVAQLSLPFAGTLGDARDGGFDFAKTNAKAQVESINGGLKLSAQKAAAYLANGKVSGFKLAILALRY